MNRTRRHILRGLAAAPAIATLGRHAFAAEARTIKISHQFKGGTIEQGDFRDRLCRMFAKEVEERTKGQLKFQIYPSASLFKSKEQFKPLGEGALDMTLLPLAYAGGMVPEVNITLMPCLVTSYEQGLRWKNEPIGKELTRILDQRGVKIITWVWQAGGTASRGKAVVEPNDIKGMKTRGAGRSMDLMLAAAGGSITSLPSDDLYVAFQSGVLDSAATSSTSLISFRLYEYSKNVTSARDKTFWFMFEPLLMSKKVFDSLTPEQQKILTEVGAKLEKFGMEASKEDDHRLANIYTEHKVKVHDMNNAAFQKWRAVAEKSAWKDFEDNTPNGKQLMAMAKAVK